MDEEIEEFRDEVVQWRGSRRQGAHPYPAAMKAKALRLAARLRTQGLTTSAAAKLLGITAITLEGWQKAPGRGGWMWIGILSAPLPSPNRIRKTPITKIL